MVSYDVPGSMAKDKTQICEVIDRHLTVGTYHLNMRT